MKSNWLFIIIILVFIFNILSSCATTYYKTAQISHRDIEGLGRVRVITVNTRDVSAFRDNDSMTTERAAMECVTKRFAKLSDEVRGTIGFGIGMMAAYSGKSYTQAVFIEIPDEIPDDELIGYEIFYVDEILK